MHFGYTYISHGNNLNVSIFIFVIWFEKGTTNKNLHIIYIWQARTDCRFRVESGVWKERAVDKNNDMLCNQMSKKTTSYAKFTFKVSSGDQCPLILYLLFFWLVRSSAARALENWIFKRDRMQRKRDGILCVFFFRVDKKNKKLSWASYNNNNNVKK